MTITELVEKAHKIATEKGFWDKPRETGTLLALIHSEISEALEADRKNQMRAFAFELADIIIRVADLAGSLNIDLEEFIRCKMEYNATRPPLHGKNY